MQGYHVEKDGVDLKIVIEDLRIIIIRTDTNTEGEISGPKVFYWDWAEVGIRLSPGSPGPPAKE